MLLNDIKTLTINSVKFSRSSGIYVTVKSLDTTLWNDAAGTNSAGGIAAQNWSTTRFTLFCTKYNVGNNNVKYYPVIVGSNVRWVSENDIASFSVVGGVIRAFYSTVIKALHRFNRKAAVAC